MLITLWRSFFAICCFRSGPQDLPVSRELLALCLSAYAFSSFLLTLSTQPVATAIFSGLIDAALLAVISHGMLWLWRLPERWWQLTTALSGTGVLFSLAAIPLSYLLAFSGNDHPLNLLLVLLVISLLVWNIGVMAHIMRHALSSSFAMGVFIALIYVWVITATINSLLPANTP